MPYVDLNTIHNPSASTNKATAAWGDQIRTNQEVFANRYLAHVYNSAAQSISHNLGTDLLFNSERRDNDTIHSTSTNTQRLTIATAGYYEFTCGAKFAANNTGLRWLHAYRNGILLDAGGAFVGNPNAAVATRLNGGFGYPCAVGDYVQWKVYQNSGGNLNVEAEATALWQAL